METSFIRKKILNVINESVHILLIAHQNPDGDTIGSALALSNFLETLGKRHKVFCKDKLPEEFLFLPGAERFSSDHFLFVQKKFDLIIVCDCSDLDFAGVSVYINDLNYHCRLINIDHHFTNQYYGDINLVAGGASSTTQVLHDFFCVNKIKITKEMATCMLTGIVTDTGIFLNPATSVFSLEAASSLLEYGARLHKIICFIEKNKSISTLRLWGDILSRLHYNPDLGIVTAIIRKQDFLNHKVKAKSADGIANFLNNLSGVRAVLVLKESGDGYVKGSFRTTCPNMDVSKLAVCLGGGGHRKAAGFALQARLVCNQKGWSIV